MVMESPVRFVGGSGARNWSPDKEAIISSPGNMSAQELEMFLKGHRFHGNRKDSVPSRSGSAPPSVEGSFAALGNLIGPYQSILDGSLASTSSGETFEAEERLRSDPSYITYYFSNVNLNPRLPPPLTSRENRHLAQHVGRSGENWKLASFDDSSQGYLLSSRASLSTHKEEPEDDRSPTQDSVDTAETSAGFLSGQFMSSLEGRHKSLVDLIQEDFPRTPSPVYSNQTRLSNPGLTEEVVDSDARVNPLQDSSIKTDKLPDLGVRAGNSTSGVHPVKSLRNSDVSANSLPSTSSYEMMTAKHVGPKGQSVMDNDIATGVTAPNLGGMVADMTNLTISSEHRSQHARQHSQQNNSHPHGSASEIHVAQFQAVSQSHGMHHIQNTMDHFPLGQPKLPSVDIKPALQTTGYAAPLYAAATGYMNTLNPFYPNMQSSGMFAPQYNMGGYAISPSLVPPFIAGYPPQGPIPMPLENPTSLGLNGTGRNVASGMDLQHLNKLYGQLGVAVQPSFPDPLYFPYFQQPSVDAYGAASQYDPVLHNFDHPKGPSPVAYSPDRSPYSRSVNIPSPMKGGPSSPNYYGSPPNLGLLMHYPTSSLATPQMPGSPAAGTTLPVRRAENSRLPVPSSRSGSYSGWQGQRGRERIDDPKTYSLLEELKSSKARRFELSDLSGRIVEFSTDQHGSRFIQQKLENCTAEEKACVFEEVLPHASTLMTDVFGNYVIQKFFEHGNAEQRKKLADQLVGHILSLSLQMYGCRVIQKALDVVELDQKTNLVLELDGHVMRCVRDQNGNHVIQKCIECVPTERIGFVISAFQGQVAALSTHPYGCRVIQRVLEHCTDELQSQCIVDEILQSACFLAQDQYGNYVTQHVLERGKPHERAQIISKLAGQIVQMSQNKFASNVIEKCLEHGDSAERELLIEEIVGQAEGNDNLLIMMKDQYANYVIQKILETCSDKQLEILLSRIKVHLQALKKYTYGKHIVARVEQLSSEEGFGSSR